MGCKQENCRNLVWNCGNLVWYKEENSNSLVYTTDVSSSLYVSADNYNIKEDTITWSKGTWDIMQSFMTEATDTLIGDYPLLDTGNNLNVWYELTDRLSKLSEKDKDKIRSIVLGINYKSKNWKI